MPRKTKITQRAAKDAEEYFGEDIFEERFPEDTRWQRGVSGNPKGRPVEPEELVDMLAYRLTKGLRKQLADKLIEMALKGNLNAITYIYDRIEGKPRQAVLNRVEVESPLVSLLRAMTTDEHAKQGHRVSGRPARGPALPAGPVVEAEVREIPSGNSGADI